MERPTGPRIAMTLKVSDLVADGRSTALAD
jgi:hypothetical protein